MLRLLLTYSSSEDMQTKPLVGLVGLLVSSQCAWKAIEHIYWHTRILLSATTTYKYTWLVFTDNSSGA